MLRKRPKIFLKLHSRFSNAQRPFLNRFQRPSKRFTECWQTLSEHTFATENRASRFRGSMKRRTTEERFVHFFIHWFYFLIFFPYFVQYFQKITLQSEKTVYSHQSQCVYNIYIILLIYNIYVYIYNIYIMYTFILLYIIILCRVAHTLDCYVSIPFLIILSINYKY